MQSTSKRWLACIGVAILSTACTVEPEIDRPDVLLIVVDTLRADRVEMGNHVLGPDGTRRRTSPRINALTFHSTQFTNATSTACWTNPSMASMFTGLAPDTMGEAGVPIKVPDSILTLGEMFKSAGYETRAVISNLYMGQKLGLAQGFDSWDEENAKGHTHVSSRSVTDKAVAILEEKGRKRPLFLLAHYYDPHYDYIEHPGLRYSVDYSGKLESINDNYHHMRAQAEAGLFGPEDIAHLLDLYDSEVAYTDAHLGRLFDELDRLDAYDDMLLVFTSDHGEALLERPSMELGHGQSLYQELLHVPLTIKLPNDHEHRVVDRLVTTRDLLPTLVDLCKLPDPHDMAARSLLRPQAEAPVFSVSQSATRLQCVRDGRWKLVHAMVSGEQQLYDLESDPAETTDVHASEPEVVARLDALRVEWEQRNTSVRELLTLERPEFSSAELEMLRQLGYTD